MFTRPLHNDSRMMLLLIAADGVEATGRMLLHWWEKTSRRGRLADQLKRLEAAGWVAAAPGLLDARIFTLTETGHRFLSGEVDPESRWARPWDQQWRVVMFDVPQAHVALRTRLRRRLRDLRFGWLQNSVWLSPDPIPELVRQLAQHAVTVESLLFIEGRPAAGESDAALVSGAWDFSQLAKLHAAYLKLLRQRPSAGWLARSADWAAWFDAEFRAWRALSRFDPFLPAPLLPPDYAGRSVWQARREALEIGARAVADASARR